MKNIFLVFVIIILIFACETMVLSSEKENIKVLQTCSLEKPKCKISVVQNDKNIRVVISADKAKKEIFNDSIVEIPSQESIAEGFQIVIAKENGFIIKQQLGSGWKFIAETLIFKAKKNKAYTFYLHSYKRETLDRRNPEKTSVERFSKAQIGEVLFQDLTRDFLIDLINK